MTEIQWFAYVILPAVLALVAFVAVRLFERGHPIPSESKNPVSSLRDVALGEVTLRDVEIAASLRDGLKTMEALDSSYKISVRARLPQTVLDWLQARREVEGPASEPEPQPGAPGGKK